MKTYRNLYPQVWNFENLYLAWRKARKGKRSRPQAASFERVQEEELLALESELRDFTYQPGPYHSFFIHDPKKRLISAAPFRDRVVHHALYRVIEPIWERRFIDDRPCARFPACEGAKYTKSPPVPVGFAANRPGGETDY